MNVRYVSEWAKLIEALNDTDVSKFDYANALADMCDELVTRLEAVRVELDEESRQQE